MKNLSPKTWVPTLYLAEGLPYTAVVCTSVILYKLAGVENKDIGLYMGWFYLPWLIKPLWSPIVGALKSSVFWIVICQLIMGVVFATIGFSLFSDSWLGYTITFFWLAAFLSATHDIAADGFYIQALDNKQQAVWVGWRSTFYKIAKFIGQGLLVFFAGKLQAIWGLKPAWCFTFGIIGLLMLVFGLYHYVVLKPYNMDNQENYDTKKLLCSIKEQFLTFFKKDQIVVILLFLLIFRLGEALLSVMSVPFLIDNDNGGLGLSAEAVGIINGTIGLITMTIGGILGGIAIARYGLRKCMIPMILALNIPDGFYVIMSMMENASFVSVATLIGIEQFGYGFGFAAYSVFMLNISKGEYSTSHYSIATAFMAAGMMLPAAASGFLQACLGYTYFFVIILLCTIPSLMVGAWALKGKYID